MYTVYLFPNLSWKNLSANKVGEVVPSYPTNYAMTVRRDVRWVLWLCWMGPNLVLSLTIMSEWRVASTPWTSPLDIISHHVSHTQSYRYIITSLNVITPTKHKPHQILFTSEFIQGWWKSGNKNVRKPLVANKYFLWICLSSSALSFNKINEWMIIMNDQWRIVGLARVDVRN